MSEPDTRFYNLLHKYTNKNCTWQEYQELFTYLEKPEYKDIFFQFMDEKYVTAGKTETGKDRVDWDLMYNNIKTEMPAEKKPFSWIRLMAAAVALFISIAGLVFFLNKRPDQQIAAGNKKYKNDVAAASNKAILTMADGSVVFLDEKENKVISREDDGYYSKAENGSLIYEDRDKASLGKSAMRFNTLTTPRGGHYTVVLPDGSKVWLNAASSLRYPTSFAGNERRVELTGEAYFEIEKDKTKPFFVKSGDAQIKVLGTHFNVMAYNSESFTQATLLEGSIQFTHGNNDGYILVPGQQALYNEKSKAATILTVNPQDYVAWKNGLFVFNNTSIQDIMKDISRWYDVDIEYGGRKVPETYFTGVIPRSVNVSKVLDVLESTGEVDFTISGKIITCSRKI